MNVQNRRTSILPTQRNSRDENARIKDGETPEGWENQPARRCQKDTDARWTKKHGKSHYGYKNHVNVDRRHKLVRRYRGTEIAEAVISRVLAALDSDDLAVKLSLVPLLGVQDGATVQATLSRLICDPDPRVRAACLRASTDLKAPGFEAAAWLDDPDPGVALAAAEALAGRGSEKATVDLLTSAVFLHDGVNRQAVARLLRRLDPPRTNAALIAVLQDDDQRRSWRVAIEVLEVMNPHDGADRIDDTAGLREHTIGYPDQPGEGS